METFQILSDQFNHFQHLFHRWLAIFFIISSYIFDLSSSPHTWGIRLTWRREQKLFRFIPTYVGHTKAGDSLAKRYAVHPHIRGAYIAHCVIPCAVTRFIPTYVGHTPLLTMYRAFLRFIPTYVGHTHGGERRRRHYPVHPHIRGAYASTHSFMPRKIRFIPTYVGHTSCGLCHQLRAPVHPHIRGAYTGPP